MAQKRVAIELETKVVIRLFVKYPAPRLYISHSAKGSTWKNHKYIKRIDGTYYYPDSYEGGRHLPDGDENKELEDWETTLYDAMDDVFKRISEGKFKPMNMDAFMEAYTFEDYDSFIEIMEDAGIDTGKYTKTQLKKMQKKAKEHVESTSFMPDNLSESDIEKLAKEVIRGNFGNGQQRKELFGDYYQQVQDRVNQLMKSSGSKSSKKDNKNSDNKKKETKSNSSKSSGNTKSIDMEKVFDVYRKKEKAAKHSLEEIGEEYLSHCELSRLDLLTMFLE